MTAVGRAAVSMRTAPACRALGLPRASLYRGRRPAAVARDQVRRPHYAAPELLATRPNEVWSWDITRQLGLSQARGRARGDRERCRAREEVWATIGVCLPRFDAAEGRNYFRHCGYSATTRL